MSSLVIVKPQAINSIKGIYIAVFVSCDLFILEAIVLNVNKFEH